MTTTPTGRQQRADARRNAEAILDAATRCLARDPDASVGDIARAAGVGRVTLYGHFANRAELVAAVVDRAIAEADAALEAVDLEVDAIDAMVRLAEATWAITYRYGALVVAGRRSGPRIALMIGGIVAFGLALMVFSFSRWMPLVLLSLFIAGAANVYYNSTNNGLIQSLVEDRYRGRVLSMLQLNRRLVPLGTAITGFFAEQFGAPAALAGMSAMLIALGVVAFLMRPRTALSPQGEEIPLK